MVTFIWNHVDKYPGRRGKRDDNNSVIPIDDDKNTLKKYDKISYSFLKRTPTLESEVRKVQFSLKLVNNWWEYKEPANSQLDLLKVILSVGQKIGGYQRLHGIHIFFDTDETIIVTYEFYTIRGFGPLDEVLIPLLQNMITDTC
jgi:hypothetical protein